MDFPRSSYRLQLVRTVDCSHCFVSEDVVVNDENARRDIVSKLELQFVSSADVRLRAFLWGLLRGYAGGADAHEELVLRGIHGLENRRSTAIRFHQTADSSKAIIFECRRRHSPLFARGAFERESDDSVVNRRLPRTRSSDCRRFGRGIIYILAETACERKRRTGGRCTGRSEQAASTRHHFCSTPSNDIPSSIVREIRRSAPVGLPQ